MANILVIDDSSLSRRMLRAILEEAGHIVAEAADGLAGIEQFTLKRPDLVLLDLTMEGMHGPQVLENLKQIDSNALVVVASADIQKTTRQMARGGGAAAFLNKPFETERVLRVVDSVLRGENAWPS